MIEVSVLIQCNLDNPQIESLSWSQPMDYQTRWMIRSQRFTSGFNKTYT